MTVHAADIQDRTGQDRTGQDRTGQDRCACVCLQNAYHSSEGTLCFRMYSCSLTKELTLRVESYLTFLFRPPCESLRVAFLSILHAMVKSAPQVTSASTTI